MRSASSFLILGILAFTLAASAGEFKFESVGVRSGFGTGGDDTAFAQYEAFGKANLPWRWDWGKNWGLQTGLDFSAGLLTRNGDAGFVGQLGLALIIGSRNFPVEFELGSNPTVLSRERFDEKDLGGAIQFSSHAGLRANLGEHWSVGYHIQHMSNAGLGNPNPGLNLQFLSVSWRF